MGVVRRATALRWTVALGGTIAIGLLPTVVAALPAKDSGHTPRQLVAEARDSAGIAHQGYAETTGSLGLPDLPRLDEVAALFGSTTHARVWWRSPQAWRVAEVTPTGERDTYAWHAALHTWDFEGRTVQTIVAVSPVRLPRLDDMLPPQAARRILAGVTGKDHLSALPAKRIAGRSADGVRIVPAPTDSTVGRVDLYVDSATGLPLSVQVYPRGSSNAAMTSHFLDIRLTSPGDSVLTPRSPLDVPIATVLVPDIAAFVDVFGPYVLPDRLGTFQRRGDLVSFGGAATYGEGLAQFIVFPLSPELGRQAFNAAAAGGIPLQISGGAAVLVGTPLLNAVIAHGNRETGIALDNRGRSYLIAGTVQPDTLRAAVVALFANPPPAK